MNNEYLFLFSFFNKRYAYSAEDEECTGYNQHSYLRACAYVFKEKASAERCHDLRDADSAVEESEESPHMFAT